VSDVSTPYRTWDRAAAAILFLALAGYAYYDVWLDLGVHRLFKWRRLLVLAAGLLVLRHLRYPSPWIGAEIWSALRHRFWENGGRFVLQVGLASRLAVLAIALAVAADSPQPRGPRASDDRFWNFVSRFDALRYLNIAVEGYEWDPATPERQWNVAFFPGFAIAQRLAGALVTIPVHLIGDRTWIGGSMLTRFQVGGLLVSIGAFMWGLRAVYTLAREDIGEDRARWAVLLLAYFPFALFYSAPYSEGLFFLALASSFLAAREGRLLAVFVWGAIAGVTRQTGVMLVVPLALLALEPLWHRARGTPVRPVQVKWLLLAASGPVLGLAIHMTFLGVMFGDPWAWVEAQKGWRHSESSFPFIDERIRMIRIDGLRSYFDDHPGAALGTLIPVFAIGMLYRAWQLSPAYAALIVLTLAPAIAIDTPSVGRIAAPLFPLFIALASLLPGSRHNWIFVLLLAMGQLWSASAFFKGEYLY
jgi:hypothetical protein